MGYVIYTVTAEAGVTLILTDNFNGTLQVRGTNITLGKQLDREVHVCKILIMVNMFNNNLT